jgi:serine acetyltransferase
VGVVPHPHTKIGANVFIGENATIGGRGYAGSKDPVVGNNVHITPDAMVMGDTTTGDNLAIGGNAVVIESVP